MSDSVLSYIYKNLDFHRKKLQQFVLKHNPKLRLIPCTSSGFVSAVPDEEKSNVIFLWNMYTKSEQDLQVAKWYLNRLFSKAVDHKTIENCIPEHYWKHTKELRITGDSSSGELFDRNSYDILEQAVLSNIILGINDESN